jgi:hypothetical protein
MSWWTIFKDRKYNTSDWMNRTTLTASTRHKQHWFGDKIEKIRIPKESLTLQNWKCCRFGLIEPVHERYCQVQTTVHVPYHRLKQNSTFNTNWYNFEFWNIRWLHPHIDSSWIKPHVYVSILYYFVKIWLNVLLIQLRSI